MANITPARMAWLTNPVKIIRYELPAGIMSIAKTMKITQPTNAANEMTIFEIFSLFQ